MKYSLYREQQLDCNHHRFESNADGVLMVDTADYELLSGIFGNLAYSLLVKKKLRGIFDYRHNVLEELFNEKTEKI